ncbi:MAG: hypothetical protein PHW10_02305 [Candidatus Peribacteraceae bacterium]|nr:hypothetical protein [Candidatus Peribacteraceae bacterium]
MQLDDQSEVDAFLASVAEGYDSQTQEACRRKIEEMLGAGEKEIKDAFTFVWRVRDDMEARKGGLPGKGHPEIS